MMEEAEAPEELLAAVEAFCRRRSTVEAADILSEFLQLPQAQLDSTVLPALLKRAVLESTGQPDKCGPAHFAPACARACFCWPCVCISRARIGR